MRVIPTTNDQMVCPHCGVAGCVRTRRVRRAQGISGGKAVAAVFTLGLSLLLTGLSRHGTVTRCHCTNCGQRWQF